MTSWRLQLPQQPCPHCGKLVWQTISGNVRVNPQKRRRRLKDDVRVEEKTPA